MPHHARTLTSLWRVRGPKSVGAFWIFAGIMHFVIPKQYEAIVPDYLPAHKELVAASGVAEIAGGVAVLHPRTRPLARWWLLGVLAAVYPANLWMVQKPERYENIPRWALWARLPLQFVCAAWTWRATAER
jgi:uncharacterized membrane protein